MADGQAHKSVRSGSKAVYRVRRAEASILQPKPGGPHTPGDFAMSQPTTGQEIETQYRLKPGAFAALPLFERALYRAAYACDVLHVHEDGPPYLNRGEDVDRYNRAAGAALGSPWCAAFWTTILLDSGCERNLVPMAPASVHQWREWAIDSGIYSREPVRGACGLFIFSPTEGHLVAVTAVDSAHATVAVIAGNTNSAGGREGFEVARRTYRIDALDGFVSPELWT